MSRKSPTSKFYQLDMLAKWRASGLSQAEFCRRQGSVTEQALSNWKRREEKKAAKAKPPSVVFGRGKKLNRKKEKPESRRPKAPPKEPGFVALQATQEETVVRDSLQDARWANGPVAEICFGEVSVRIWRGADQETVSAVLDALKEYYTC